MLLCILLKNCTVDHLFVNVGGKKKEKKKKKKEKKKKKKKKKTRTLGWELGTIGVVSPWWLDPLCTYSAVRG